MVFTFVNPVPCEKVEAVIAIMTNLTKSQRCETENEACVSSVEIRNCVGTGNRRKRASDTELLIVLTIPILSNGSFDLAAYFATSVSKFYRLLKEVWHTLFSVTSVFAALYT
jgi:hypothetical protein